MWIEKGNPNVLHWKKLLDAEAAVYNMKYKMAEENYYDSIKIASRGGFIHDAALACERYGDLLLKKLKDKESARYQLQKARRLYLEWGANVKARQLERRYAHLRLDSTD